MNVVFLSGGSGKRLWPLSNDTFSKQFLKLLKNDDGHYESMVQRVVRQLRQVKKGAAIHISCNMSQSDMIKRQLHDVEIISEPARRDTFAAIALAAAYLFYTKQLQLEDVFVVCPIDPFTENAYFQLLSGVADLVANGGYNIGLMGALPTYPSEKYGYILQTNGKVERFTEKPSLHEAEKLIAQGAVWNCGVFALKLGYVLDCARKYVAFDSYESLHKQYEQLPKISFDYEIVEKAEAVGAVIYDGMWKDLGTWNTLTDEMSDTSLGETLIAEDSTNTHVLNMLNIPIVVKDVTDAVVVASHDGILVSSKAGSALLKPQTDKISLRPMYEQCEWGDYRVLEYKQTEQDTTLVKRVRIEPGKTMHSEAKPHNTESWVMVKGKGILTVNKQETIVKTGNVVNIQNNERGYLLAATEIELINVQVSAHGGDEA